MKYVIASVILVIVCAVGDHYSNQPTIIEVVEAEEIDSKRLCGLEVVKCNDEVEEETEPEEKEWNGTARITAYSEFDSCHYPDGKGGCLNAYNETIQKGQIACPRNYKKGTMIEIDGLGKFKCMDKTAEWVQEDLGMTFDVWIGYGQESYDEAVAFGNKQLRYKII